MARRIEIGTPTSCGDCPAAGVMLCAGSTLEVEFKRKGIPDGEKVQGTFPGVVIDGERFGCGNEEIPKQMANVLSTANLNGTKATAEVVVTDYALSIKARRNEPLPEGTNIQVVRTRLRTNIQQL